LHFFPPKGMIFTTNGSFDTLPHTGLVSVLFKEMLLQFFTSV